MDKDLKYSIKINIFRETMGFGPGVAKLLKLVEEKGSLNKAYEEMGLSSSKGWRIIKKAEEDLGFPLVITQIGGSQGGGSKLSKEGRDFLESYLNFINDAENSLDIIFKKHFEL